MTVPPAGRGNIVLNPVTGDDEAVRQAIESGLDRQADLRPP